MSCQTHRKWECALLVSPTRWRDRYRLPVAYKQGTSCQTAMAAKDFCNLLKTSVYIRILYFCVLPSVQTPCIYDIRLYDIRSNAVADPGGGGPGGPDPPPFGPRCRLFNIGPKVGPPLGPPLFFACRPKMDPPPFQKSWIRPCNAVINQICSK